MPRVSALLAAAALAFAIPACGADEGAGSGAPNGEGDKKDGTPASSEEDPKVIAEKLAEKPWEIISSKGETVLPNVFYADDVENEQIMPYALGGHTMIDRLVYPTLGNPNLYVKGDAEDQFMTVLRLEEEAWALLAPQIEEVPGSPLKKLVIPAKPETGIAVFLVPRAARASATESKDAISSGNGTGVLRVYPNEILISPEPADMPASLKKRKTLRLIFRQAAMQRVPAGLYDVRFEVRKDNELVRPKLGMPGIYEYQYNAVRVFDTEPEEYKVVNVTDTQVSVGMTYDAKTRDKLEEFVQFVNTTNDANVRNAAFITFNGDLHNGGSPGSLRQRTVAHTYEEEAKAIVDQLKYLPFPIFLTTGNHDGYVSVGHVPSGIKATDSGLGESLAEVISDATDKPWPNFQQSDFDKYLQQTEAADNLGGFHKDIFTGSFTRSAKSGGTESFAGWKEVARKDRNFILYDGFHQWQKTYGPLYYSWKFGKNAYVSVNSFELRQHRRSGWGMYTVNYGGGMSDVQMKWLERELLRAKTEKTDVVVLAHHDPRGGHKGQDLGYYFEQLEYRSIWQSAINYLASKVWNEQVCKLPPWALSRDQEQSCTHDGLQEWMRPDPDFDGDYVSGMELMKLLSQNGQVRTVLLGHTHYNSLEVFQGGDQLLPGQLAIDGTASQKFAALEVQNPIRGYAVFGEAYDQRYAPWQDSARVSALLSPEPMERRYEAFTELYARAVPSWPQRTLDNPAAGVPRELVVLRLVSNADLASQTYSGGKNAMGFSILHVAKAGAYPNAQINKATFFANTGAATFANLKTIDIPRTQRLHPHDPTNPIEELFDW
jgi:hypothetical protein